MTKEQKEGNKLIALFMGYEETNYSDTLVHPEANNQVAIWELMYDESWDRLMPVIEKIMDLCFNQGRYTVDDFYDIRDCIPDINQTFKSVVSFLKLYNE